MKRHFPDTIYQKTLTGRPPPPFQADADALARPVTTSASGLLHTWDTTGLPACAYRSRLSATDKSVIDRGRGRQLVEDQAAIVLGGLAGPDLDEDGDVDIFDYMLFQLEFIGPMP